ncbi:MAG: ABC transporter ATP-binding protein [Halodesulfurarchaeum sp.]
MSRNRSTQETAARGTEKTDVPAVQVSDLQLGYGEDPVVDVDHLTVPRGDVTALVGPNGSGKSTFLRGIAAELEPDAGTLMLNGRAVQERSPKELARELGLLDQENTAPADLTVESLVTHGRYPHRQFLSTLADDDWRAIDRAIDLAGVAHLREQPVAELSGGQKQLAFLAMALAQETEVLLLDEPTAYLDLHHQIRVLEVVRQLNHDRNVTVCLVLHDLQQAARFADHVVALQDGRVHDWGPPSAVVDETLLAEVFDVEADVSTGDVPRIDPRRALESPDG